MNPRWTASAELYERHHHWPLIRWHVDACMQQHQQPSDVPTTIAEFSLPNQDPDHHICGRMVVYTPHDTSLTENLKGRDFENIRHHTPVVPDIEFADMPQPTVELHPCTPLCTLLTTASTTTDCRHILLEAASGLRVGILRHGGARLV